MKKILIGIIDDHPAISQGLTCEFNSRGKFNVVFNALNINNAMEHLQKSDEIDVLVMDVVLPGSSGIEQFHLVLEQFPNTSILAYTSLTNPVIVELLLRAGVRGYCCKSETFGQLCDAVEIIYNGGLYLSEEYRFLKSRVVTEGSNIELSKREIEVLTLIAQGKTTNEIAEILFISVNTVETHRKKIFLKLNVNNVAELVKISMDLGYLK